MGHGGRSGLKNKLFFFGDYEETHTVQGITSPETTVPSVAERTGNFSDAASTLTGAVSGPYIASLLTKELGYGVTAGERYYVNGCTNPSECVFPNAIIPKSAWSAPAENLLSYIPVPNIGSNLFSTSAYPETVTDRKGGGRIDANTRLGQISGYYFIDAHRLTIPTQANREARAYRASTPSPSDAPRNSRSATRKSSATVQ